MTTQKNRRIKRLTAMLIMSIGMTAAQLPAHALSCVVDTTVPKTVLGSKIKRSTQSAVTALSDMDKQVANAMDFQTSAIQAAVNTLTSQKALGASQLGQAIIDNTQLQTAAIQQIETAQRVKDTLIDYGASSAGHKVCQVVAERQNIVKTDVATTKAIADMIATEMTARPGRYAARGEALATRLALHDKLYCTASQAAAKLCAKEAARAGRSLTAATLFVPADYDSAEYRDKSAFINNMVGLPDTPLKVGSATTAQGQSYANLKRRKDAIVSTAIHSLKNIQADWSATADNNLRANNADTNRLNTNKALPIALSERQQLAQANTVAKVKAQTFSERQSNLAAQPIALQIKNDVNRYLGSGQEYKDWSKTLVGSSERGVLQEILRIKALRLYLQSKQYKQLSRMESMLAANVAAETYRTGMQDDIKKQRQALMHKKLEAALNK